MNHFIIETNESLCSSPSCLFLFRITCFIRKCTLAALDESIFCRLGGLDKNKLEIDRD